MRLVAESLVRWAAVLGVGWLAGCAGDAGQARIRGQFSARYSCAQESVKVERWYGGWEATGCEHIAHYECLDGYCLPLKEGKETPTVAELHVSVTLDEAAVLRMTAVPSEGDRAEVWIDGYSRGSCAVEFYVDGQRYRLQAGKRGERRLAPRGLMRELGRARQVGVGACQRRWLLAQQDILQLRRFADRYLLEVDADEDEDEKVANQPPPPLDGWKSWQPLDGFPRAAPEAEVLSGQQLFQKLSPAVARVECKTDDGFMQGSAVAVAPTVVATHCHVVSGALEIKVKQGEREWRAALHSSDFAKDRCVLDVPGATFTPIGGVRPYADLATGEHLYTLGAPSGLELTLTDGILSARREDSGVRYVQTTAPISPGSSGGGLFDARGNLVGITTLSFVGKTRLNQSLNFAIAAEMFWSP